MTREELLRKKELRRQQKMSESDPACERCCTRTSSLILDCRNYVLDRAFLSVCTSASVWMRNDLSGGIEVSLWLGSNLESK